MPGGDRTGPSGAGPKTGRQLGNCPGATPIQTPRRGRGLGPGRGGRRGRRGR